MNGNSSGFSLDELRIDVEVRPPSIIPISIMVCKTEFTKPVEDLELLKKQIKSFLTEKYIFRKEKNQRFKDGFLEFSDTGKILECFYARESPTKIDFERDDLKIHTERFRHIDPNNCVKIKVQLDNTSAKVVLFGGSEQIIKTALDIMNVCIRSCIRGGFRTSRPSFSKEDMTVILKNFGLNVESIWIHPGESEKFVKIVERQIEGEIVRETEYLVHAKLMGYRITGSPITIGLIEESGVHLREIQGMINFAAASKITVRVSSSGRILFFLPESLLPKEVGSRYTVAEDLYERIIAQRVGPQQLTIGEYIAEEN